MVWGLPVENAMCYFITVCLNYCTSKRQRLQKEGERTKERSATRIWKARKQAP